MIPIPEANVLELECSGIVDAEMLGSLACRHMGQLQVMPGNRVSIEFATEQQMRHFQDLLEDIPVTVICQCGEKTQTQMPRAALTRQELETRTAYGSCPACNIEAGPNQNLACVM